MKNRTTGDPLAGTRPPFIPDPGEPVDPDRRERDLRAILAQPREVAPRPSPAPMRRRVRTLTAAAAAVLVAAVVVANTPSSEPSEAGPVESPREVLLAAADAAADAPAPTASRYWYTRTRSHRVELVPAAAGHAAYHVVVGLGGESWVSRTRADPGVGLTLDVTTRPLTDRDDAEWKKAGKPLGGPLIPTDPNTGEPALGFSVEPVRAGELKFFLAEREIPLSEVLALPTDPAGLTAYLRDRFRRAALGRVDPSTESHWLAWEAARLLSGEMPTTRETRVAAYTMLADLPGLRTMNRTELPDGAVVGVAAEERTGPHADVVTNGVVELQLIIDPATGLLKEKRDVVVEPGTGTSRVPVGTVTYSETVVQGHWVDTDPVLPPGTDLDQLVKEAGE
ncbi:CU044_5270 family protein [Actinophytocola xanthii]|uniref:Uncharacterized protein n=1 Tax=Actinophytocola xanthii TaxID=1912961 RepID=A0A1Q8CKD3_9PSEU|nr:CU044_5270 family protein [Actinophytocola xanthii]OLF14824.1 hypothetical protein BU204_25025 [Actinophytocola xanthii]